MPIYQNMYNKYPRTVNSSLTLQNNKTRVIKKTNNQEKQTKKVMSDKDTNVSCMLRVILCGS